MLYLLGKLGCVVTQLKSNGRWVCDVVFLDWLLDDNGTHHCESIGGEKGLKFPELKKQVKREYGIQIPTISKLKCFGKNTGGKVYNVPPNHYTGSDLIENTFEFLGIYHLDGSYDPIDREAI